MAFLPGRIRAALVPNVALPRPAVRYGAAASRLAEGLEADRYRRLLQPWVSNASDDVISIRADMVDGFRLVA
jgi:hypothetical protein